MLRRRRRKIMGIPVGKARHTPSIGRLAGAGAVGATALAAVPVARKGMHMAGRAHEVAGKAGDLAGKAGDVVGKVGEVEKAVSSHSSTVGKAVGLVGAVRKLAGGGGNTGGTGKPKLAHLIEEHNDISAPRSVVYNQWTQMEMFPALVKGIEAVDQDEDEELEWTSKIGPVRRQWKAKITEQVPDEKIEWESEGGPQHRGVVTFHSLDDELTRVLIQMHYVPSGPLEVVGNKLRIQRRRVRRDLRLFKHYLELRGEATGAWRGSIGENSAGRQGPQSANGRRRPAESGRTSARGRASGSGRASSASRGSTSSRRAASGSGRSRSSASTSGRSASGRSTGRTSTSSRPSSNGKAPAGRRATTTRSREAAK